MSTYGLSVQGETGSKRVALECEHQNGLVYVVPSEASWVCTEDLLHVHALAGFFKQLSEMNDPQVKEAMQRWGLYYRSRALASKNGGSPSPQSSPSRERK